MLREDTKPLLQVRLFGSCKSFSPDRNLAIAMSPMHQRREGDFFPSLLSPPSPPPLSSLSLFPPPPPPPQTKTKHHNPQLLAFGLQKVDDKLYAFGGTDGHTYLRSMERYSIEDDLWEHMIVEMLFPLYDSLLSAFGFICSLTYWIELILHLPLLRMKYM